MKKLSIIFYLVVAILVVPRLAHAAGEVDPTFNGGVYGTGGGTVSVIKLLPDGKMLIGGSFTVVQGYAAAFIARLNADGTVDTSFNGPGLYGTLGSGGGHVYSIEVLADGKILVGGNIHGAAPYENHPGVRRLNPDGSLDSSFTVVPLEGNRVVYDMVLQPDGKIVIAGSFFISSAPFPNNRSIARLNPDGTLDTTYTATASGTTLKDLDMFPDGKIVAGGGSTTQSSAALFKFDTNGAVDNSFAQPGTGNGPVEAVKVLPNGKVIAAGDFTVLNAIPQGRISRLNANGAIDLTFSGNDPGADGSIRDVAIRPDGKIIIGGSFSNYNATPIKRIARLNGVDGSLDNTFTNSDAFTNTVINHLLLLSDNRILAGGSSPTSSVLRFNADGGVDTSLDVRPSGSGSVRKVLQQPDGKILVAGTFSAVNGIERRSVARFNSDGTLDTSFVPYFGTSAPFTFVNTLAVQPDGKILVGTNNGLVLVRLNSDGSQDMSFSTVLDPSSNIHDIEVLPDGKIVAAGTIIASPTTYRLARFHPNGAIDNTLSATQFNNLVYEFVIQPDGKFIVGGEFTLVAGVTRNRIARLNADGSHDASFNPVGGAIGSVIDLGLLPDGKILVGGWFSSLNGNTNIKNFGRLNADGSLDASFAPVINGPLDRIRIQPDGKILIAGQFSFVEGSVRNTIARLHPNGTLDLGFAPSPNAGVLDMDLQTDGKILICGQFTRVNGISKIAIARLLNASVPVRPLFDYDGDGKADVSVFRPSENRWYVFRSSDSAVTQQVFAIAGDVPVPADYDGDLKTDFAIYRPSTGGWWYLSSINGTQNFVQWGGEAGDVPRPSDFDGDGKSDFVFFRPTNNFWYRITSGGTVSNVQFGSSGDKPVRGDFDSDGKFDPAIYRPSTGDWWYLSSINGAQLAVHWGISTDIPAAADFDGDGRTDFAVYRPSTGVWYIMNSSNGSSTIMGFGLSEDKPVPADYDGDGKADIAVFRPSTGVWYLQRSTSGFTAMQFGVATDIPTENAFVP